MDRDAPVGELLHLVHRRPERDPVRADHVGAGARQPVHAAGDGSVKLCWNWLVCEVIVST